MGPLGALVSPVATPKYKATYSQDRVSRQYPAGQKVDSGETGVGRGQEVRASPASSLSRQSRVRGSLQPLWGHPARPSSQLCLLEQLWPSPLVPWDDTPQLAAQPPALLPRAPAKSGRGLSPERPASPSEALSSTGPYYELQAC